MRIVVTGAAGFLGFHLSRRLLADGHEVIGVDNLVSGHQDNARDLAASERFEWRRQDMADGINVDGPVDGVFNLGCPASPVDFGPKAMAILRACSEGTRQTLELATAKGAVYLLASTSECYGDPLEHPQRETYFGNVNTIGPRSVYDEGKRFSEAMTMAYRRTHGTRTRIVRIFNTYGERMRLDDGRALPNFIRQGLRGEPVTVYGDGSQTRSLCYVADLIDGLIRLTECDYAEPINLGNDNEVTMRTLAEEVVELTGGRSRIVFEPLPEDDPKCRRPDLTRAREILGWEPRVDRRTGLIATIADMRARLGDAAPCAETPTSNC